MKINSKGLDLIKRWEGLKLTSYLCPASVWTVGYGHTGADVARGLVIDQSKANELLAQDLRKFELGVARLIGVDLNENQFSALVCFAYNCGIGNLEKSSLLKYVNLKEFVLASLEFGRWNKARGLILPGLTRRRQAEKELFLT